jgi:hypothetical protein
MFLNPLYFSLEYDDPIHGGKNEKDGIKMLNESIGPILDIQTSNHKPDFHDIINAFSIR